MLTNTNTPIPVGQQGSRKAYYMDLAFRMVGALPLWANHAVGALVGLLLALIPNRHRRITRRNLLLCFPQYGRLRRTWLMLRSLQESCKGMAELGIFWRRRQDHGLGLIREIRGADLLDQAIANGDPILFGAMHYGSWELLNLYFSSRTPATFLYREPHDSGVEALLVEARQACGAKLIRANNRGIRQLMRTAAKGEAIGMVVDHQPRRGKGVFAPFFGHQALTMVLFSKLVRKRSPTVIFGYAERLSWGRGYRLHLFQPTAAIGGDDQTKAAQALNQTVEDVVRRHPEQYEWTYKRFAMRPDGSVLDY